MRLLVALLSGAAVALAAIGGVVDPAMNIAAVALYVASLVALSRTGCRRGERSEQRQAKRDLPSMIKSRPAREPGE